MSKPASLGQLLDEHTAQVGKLEALLDAAIPSVLDWTPEGESQATVNRTRWLLALALDLAEDVKRGIEAIQRADSEARSD